MSYLRLGQLCIKNNGVWVSFIAFILKVLVNWLEFLFVFNLILEFLVTATSRVHSSKTILLIQRFFKTSFSEFSLNYKLKCVQNSYDMILVQTELYTGSAQTFALCELFKLSWCFPPASWRLSLPVKLTAPSLQTAPVNPGCWGSLRMGVSGRKIERQQAHWIKFVTAEYELYYKIKKTKNSCKHHADKTNKNLDKLFQLYHCVTQGVLIFT